MSHPNAALTPRHHLKVARLVVDNGWPISEVAARFQVSWPTVKRWVDRHLAGEPVNDSSSRPKTSPNKTPKAVSKRCVSLRMRLREGPVPLATRLGIAASTAHRILTAARLNRLSYLDRATGEPIRAYEHPYPGSLVHVDVKKLGNIPDGGGWRYVGRRQGKKNRSATPDNLMSKWGNPKLGYAFMHTIIDDHSSVAYSETHDDETAVTAVGGHTGGVQIFLPDHSRVPRLINLGVAQRTDAAVTPTQAWIAEVFGEDDLDAGAEEPTPSAPNHQPGPAGSKAAEQWDALAL